MHDHPQGSLECSACKVLDRADGVEDGKLYRTLAPRIGDERSVLRHLKRAQDVTTDKITAFAGSMSFVYIHTVWFALWIAVNLGLLGGAVIFDHFPFGLLTMVVSLEAIFLATFVMISQNRQAARSDIRSQIDFENNLRGEIWAVHIGHALNIDTEHVEAVVTQALAGYLKETSQSSFGSASAMGSDAG